ncbi:MAG: DUF460 domain-containing protein [Candidatus Aenigmatarchaeota archaeon]
MPKNISHIHVSFERPFIIAGVDVGKHTSIALIDISGEIIDLVTFVNLQLSEILKYLTKMGNVFVFSTDRSTPPYQIKKIAASLSAKIILPSKNMTKKKKRVIISNFIKEGGNLPKRKLNDHEKSALASAIFAYKKFRPSFKKLEDRHNGNKEIDILRKKLFLKMISN